MAFLMPRLTAKLPKRRRTAQLCQIASVAPTVDDYLRAAVLRLPSCGSKLTESDIAIKNVTLAPGQQNEHYRIDVNTPVKKSFLAKVSRRGGAEALAGEKASLEALQAAAPSDTLFIPQTLCTGTIDSGLKAYAIQPYVSFAPFGSAIPHVQTALGKALAHIHMHTAADKSLHGNRFGFHRTTYLGAVPQDNTWSRENDWVAFFIEQRLRPRLDEALSRFSDYGTSNETSNALGQLGNKIVSVDSPVVEYLFDGLSVKPSLLHGDLFMGNCGALAGSRQAAMYDPASYFGHSELDLALGTMWGKFSADFYRAYHESMGGPDSRFYERQEIYRLYYLLSVLVVYGPGFGSRGDAVSPDG